MGDHLGSTSLVVDASTSPQVVSRQYYKPYGAVAWWWGTVGMAEMTTVGYTGQRVDVGSGLMYYGARFYDPVLSFFLSADTVSPDPSDPKTRNRYQYVVSNPLGRVDPTGHSEQRAQSDLSGGKTPDYAEELLKYGFMVSGDWKVDDLAALLAAIRDFMKAGGVDPYDYDAFRHLVGIKDPVSLVPDAVGEGGLGGGYSPGSNTITLDRQWIRDRVRDHNSVSPSKIDYESALKYFFVHELAHMWDENSDFALSNGMHYASYYNNDNTRPCDRGMRTGCLPGDDMAEDNRFGAAPASSRAEATRWEYWAEAVASTIYPDFQLSSRLGGHTHGNWVPSETNSNLVRALIASSRCFSKDGC